MSKGVLTKQFYTSISVLKICDMNEIKSIINKDFCGERKSFLQLIEKYSIVIPVIQRDYAQGRTDEHATEVRKNFVRNLILYIRDVNNCSHDLDFIFGTVSNTSSSSDYQEFIPLDGQQRLTTLFLFHLYIAGRSGHFEDFIKKMTVAEHTYKFSYKTRNSSTLFCERLLSKFNTSDDKETDIFEQLEHTEEVNTNQKTSLLLDTILDQGWFYKAWLEDPTIAGMLVTLNEIDNQFLELKGKEQYSWQEAYERLFEIKDGKNPPITFHLLPLNGYSRTDDLYIKLNARGIHLSDFENFKARIEDLIEYDGMDCKDDFKKKVDIEWSEYLWKFRDGKDNTDSIIENLFRNFIAFSFRSKDKEIMDYLLEQNKKSMRFTFSRYCELGVMHRRDEQVNQSRINVEKNMIQKIMDLFDVFCNEKTAPEGFKCDWFNAKEFIKNGVISKGATYHQRLKLYSYLRYVIIYKSALDEHNLQEWMRFVRNLDEATDIDDSAKFSLALDSIDDILDNVGNQNIQDWLSTSARGYKLNFFRQRMIKEECIKAELMKKENEFGLDFVKQAVEIGDKSKYFKGQMGFALEFADVYTKYDTNQISSLNQSEIYIIGNKVKLYIEKVNALINALEGNQGKLASDRLLERALLSLGMYLRKNSAKRLNFCNQLNDPYNSWKTLLFVEEDNAHCRSIFKKMLDNVSVNSLKNDLNTIIRNHSMDTNIPTWRRMLIDNKELIDYCSQGFIYMDDWTRMDENNVDIILFSQSQMNHYHAELWSKDLNTRYNWSKCSLEHGYHAQKSYDADSTIFIVFNDKVGEKNEFQLAHWNGQWHYWFIDKDGKDATSSFSSFTPTNTSDGEKILDEAIEYLGEV